MIGYHLIKRSAGDLIEEWARSKGAYDALKLVVTLDGKPMADQELGIEMFKAACLASPVRTLSEPLTITVDRYTGYIRDEMNRPHPNFARVSSVARSIAKLAEVSLTDQTLNAGD